MITCRALHGTSFCSFNQVFRSFLLFTTTLLFPSSSVCRRAYSLLLLSLLLAGFSSQVLGQKPQPVARLITTLGPSAAPHARIAVAAPTAVAAVAASTSIEQRAFNLINAQRQAQGLAPLAWDGSLCYIARQHSENMAQKGFFNHVGPDGLDTADRARTAGIIN